MALPIAAVLCLTMGFKVGASAGDGSGKHFFKSDPRQRIKMNFDRMELEIPTGAADRELSVELVEPDLTGINKPPRFRAISKAYRFGPGGTRFAVGKELNVKIALEEQDQNARLYYINRAAKRLEQVGDQALNRETGKLEVKIKHFSDYVLGISAGWDGNSLNPFSDYITNGIETVQTCGHLSESGLMENTRKVIKGLVLKFILKGKLSLMKFTWLPVMRQRDGSLASVSLYMVE
jgi:hypothetical protein